MKGDRVRGGEPVRGGDLDSGYHRLDVNGYLRRLGVEHSGPPSVDGLAALHRAHVARVPYETVEIHVGCPTTVDPYESAHRIITRRQGGYCYHLNGAFAALLSALGYQVNRHRGGVQRRAQPSPPGVTADHLALTVTGLASERCPDGSWLVDVGLGDALYEPLPLRAGEHVQAPFRYRLIASTVAPGGWRFEHDPAGVFAGMDFEPRLAALQDFADKHRELTTSPESGFVKVFTAQRRDQDGVDALRGCVLSRVDAAGRHEREISTGADWYAVLAGVFGLTLDHLDRSQRAGLWRRVRTAHEEWRAAQLPTSQETLPA